MKPAFLHDRGEIESFLRRSVYLNIYAIGDLDDFFWPFTTWYVHRDHRHIRQIALLYTGSTPPTLVALTDERIDEMRELLASITPLLPRRFHAHLSEGLCDVFRGDFSIRSYGIHFKMALTNPLCCERVEASNVIQLGTSDRNDLERFYAVSYPGNWFDPRMLETGQYYGIREHSDLISVAGVHVYSRAYRVAALGNIATHPDHRGRGNSIAVTARLCRSLLETVDHIGLNVKTDNETAITCYRKLGFESIATYEECLLT